jgi:putative chitinase
LISGRRNYKTISDKLNLTNTSNDLIKYPEKALDPLISYRAISAGMLEGIFTGKKLSDYLINDKLDYSRARRIINGSDHGKEIAKKLRKLKQYCAKVLNRE